MIRAAIVTVSDSAATGARQDRSGPALAERAEALGWAVAARRVVADQRDEIAQALRELADSGAVDLILTTGGTGLAPRDVTPEATRQVAEREAPGFGELMRAEGLKTTRFAALSRGGAFTRGPVLILNLPGSPRGAVESLMAVADLIPHAADLLHGRTGH
jgi:molybdopterin adenylyltransferase